MTISAMEEMLTNVYKGMYAGEDVVVVLVGGGAGGGRQDLSCEYV